MAGVDLTVAFALIGVGWAAIAVGLGRSTRAAAEPPPCIDLLAVKTARWRPTPDNRPAEKFAVTHEGGRV